jgi:hypothetical protein
MKLPNYHSNSSLNVSYNYQYSEKSKYFVLGEWVEIESKPDTELAITISILNVLGKPFYEQLVKQNITFPVEVEEVIKKNLLAIDRENKIDEIIK